MCDRLLAVLSQEAEDQAPLPLSVCKQLIEKDQPAAHSGGPPINGELDEEEDPSMRWGISETELEGESVISLESIYLHYAALHGLDIQLLEMKRLKNKAKKAKSAEAIQQEKEKAKEEKEKEPEEEGKEKEPIATHQVVDAEPTITPLPHRPYYIEVCTRDYYESDKRSQVAKVLYLWGKQKEFPVEFKTMVGQDLFAVVDNVTPMKDLTLRVLEGLEVLHSSQDSGDDRKAQAVLFDILKVDLSS